MPKVKGQVAPYVSKPKSRTPLDPKLLSPRKAVTSMLSAMRDSATYKDILYHVYVMHRIDQGEKDIQQGRVYSHAQMKKMLAKWLK